MSDEAVREEAALRRTFAIISHPDAGKTTLTEKLLLYGGAIELAGAVKARRGRRSATSDWMAIERERGISVTSTVLRFPYRDHLVNLLDTPGHRDFSEDTYRVLTACDAALMVLDAAKGLEDQTRKLFAVCRRRGLPVVTFVNKCDRPGRGALELLDEIESEMGLRPTPVTWPVGSLGAFEGLVDRTSGEFLSFARTARGATRGDEEAVRWTDAPIEPGAREVAEEELGLLDAVEADADRPSFLRQESTPVFFGSALTNFGVRQLLDALVDLAPAPAPWRDVDDRPRPIDAPFSGVVFKVQANTDPQHRDRIAFLRICSGRFARGMTLTQAGTGRTLTTRHAHLPFGRERRPLEEAYPGDVVGLVNAAELRIGDTLYVDEPVSYPPIPTFAPEHFAVARNTDAARYKQFRRGLAQLDEEGVVQVLRHPDRGDQEPVLAAVGPMQFEVALDRFTREFNTPVRIDPPRNGIIRRVDEDVARVLRGRGGVEVLERASGELMAVFRSRMQLEFFEQDHPTARLETLAAG